MAFLCLTKALPARTFVLLLLALHWMGTAEAIAQSKSKPATNSTAQQQESPPAKPLPPASTPAEPEKQESQKQAAPQTEPQSQTDEKQETDTETEPEPEPEPPTEEEKELVKRLLIEANARVYETRRSAQRQLISLGHRLPKILLEVGPPESLEAKAAINKALRLLDERKFTLVSWRLTVWPKEGESLDLGPSTISFNKDKSFVQSGQGNSDPETWEFDKRTKKLTLSLNGGYAIYTGSEDEDGNFVGGAKNIKDKEWHFKLEPVGRLR